VEMQRDSSIFKHGLLFASVVEGTMWKCRGTAVRLNMDCCLLQLWRGLCGNAEGQQYIKHGLLFASVVEGTMWKCRGTAVRLKMDCCLLQLWRGLCGNAEGQQYI